jgi:hypothetical protein
LGPARLSARVLYSFFVLRSSFVVRRSSFFVLRSSFFVLPYSVLTT